MTDTASDRAKIFNDIVGKLSSGGKVSREEFGEFIKAQNHGANSGLAIGAKIPDFSLSDQDGKPRRFQDLAGADGLLLVFSRSADW